jgi:chromosome partitioning protein
MPAELIAIANHKGGVGKSFTAVSLAAGLAQAKWATLLVDCDAQGNATTMYRRDEDVEHDLYDVIEGGLPVGEAIVPTRVDGLDLLPSTLEVALLDQQLFTKHRREEQVRRSLAPVLDRYDAIVLDLAPNLGALVIAALCASTSLIVPTDASRWGRRGVDMFLTWTEALRTADVLTADFLGVLLTKYEATTRVSRDVLTDLQASGLPLFDTVIHKRVAAERMVDNGLVVGDPDADTDLAEGYAKFTVEVIERAVAAQAERGRHRG